MAVGGAEKNRTVGHDAVELPTVQPLTGGDGVVEELHPLDPLPLRVGGGIGGGLFQDRGEGGRLFQPQFVQPERSPQQVEVAVDQTGQQRTAAGVDHFGLGPAPGQRLGGPPDKLEAVAAHRHRLPGGASWVGGVNRRVDKQKIGVLGHRRGYLGGLEDPCCQGDGLGRAGGQAR
jgi:hypothetical protein